MLKKVREFLSEAFRGRQLRTFLAHICISLAFLSLYVLLTAFGDLPPVRTGIAVALFYIAAMIAFALLSRCFAAKLQSVRLDDSNPLLNNLTLDFMVKLAHPTLICDDNGLVVWHNRAMASRAASRESLYGKNVSRLCGLELSALTTNPPPEGVEIEAFGGFYRLRCYRLSSRQKSYTVIVWNEITELKAACKKLADEDSLVAYIIIDNLDELMQYVKEKYRDASSEVAEILGGWADSTGGILKEYEHDKFIFIFAARCLEEFKANKFDVLDRIRDVRIGDGKLPVTVSIGISKTAGTLAEKERASHSALDLALQRGGDQVVLKNAGEIEFFGGKTKSVQKRTKVRARVVANELVTLISRSSNVLIMGHRFADYDAIGACAGIARLAAFCGVKANIIANLKDPNLKKAFDKLLSQPDYGDIFLDAVSAQELITSETLLVITDVNNRTQFESTDIADNVRNVVYIDHHRKTAEFREPPALTYIEPSASSTCELVSEILEQAMPNGLLQHDEAEVMLAGILLDTKQFARNTGVRTFSAALYLRNEGASTAEAQALFKSGLDDFMREARFESNVTIYRSVIAIAVNDSDASTNADRIAAAKASDRLLNVDSVVAAFSVFRMDGTVYISARSSGSLNVQLVLEKLGGGGHFDAAATQIKEATIEETLPRLKSAIDAQL